MSGDAGEVGGYLLHLYCQDDACPCHDPTDDRWRQRAAEYAGPGIETAGQARKAARADGWRKVRGRWVCPHGTAPTDRPEENDGP